MTDSPRARTLINLSAVLYEHNMDLDFMSSVAFIPNVYIADSLRVRILINLSVVLYEQAAARTGLPAEVSNMDLNFVPGVAFISNVYIADSLRARTPINLSVVLLRARTLINPSAVLYEQADAQSGLPAEVGIIDLDFVPGVAFDAMGNVELTGDFPTALLNLRSLALKRPASSGSDLNCGRTDPTIATLLAKRIKTDEDRKKSTHYNIEELICVGKVKHTYVSFRRAENNRNNLNIMVTDPTGREFGRVDIKSLTRLCLLIDGAKANGLIWMAWTDIRRKQLYCKRKWAYDIGKFYKGKNIQLLRPFTQQGLTPRELGSIYVLRIVSKLDKVPTREPSSYIKTELRKFYHLVITSEDTHCKQTIKKAYIMSLERASLILFMI
ncbi:hypothetical protein HBI23_220500 [Parastagonospora nodorum]|nr:hypothetical protein HBI23_220500 [Parastagonospora nodorum]